MTDSDTKERLALASVWPSILLLICLFHLAKACGNHMAKVLGRGVTRGDERAGECTDILAFLAHQVRSANYHLHAFHFAVR